MARNKGSQGRPHRLIRKRTEKQQAMGQSRDWQGLGPVVLFWPTLHLDGETRPASDTGRDILPLCKGAPIGVRAGGGFFVAIRDTVSQSGK